MLIIKFKSWVKQYNYPKGFGDSNAIYEESTFGQQSQPAQKARLKKSNQNPRFHPRVRPISEARGNS